MVELLTSESESPEAEKLIERQDVGVWRWDCAD